MAENEAEEAELLASVTRLREAGEKTEPCFSCGKETTMLAYILGPEARFYDREGWTVPACCPREECCNNHNSSIYRPPFSLWLKEG